MNSSTDHSAEKLRLLPIPITPVEHTVDGDFDGASSICSADVDGDGDADILGAGWYCDDIAWWENTDGTGTLWAEHTVDGDFDGAYSVYPADVDGDGDIDVLGAGGACGDITWWENTCGTGIVWTEHIVDDCFEEAYSVFSTDVDGDGDTDVLGAGHDCDDITWWENVEGSGISWVEHPIDGDFWKATSVFSTDVDGDGDADVLGAAGDFENITWWENTDGTGKVWVEHIVDYEGTLSIYSTDIDGDGDADVLGAGENCDDGQLFGKIAWWENTDGIGTVWTEHVVDGDFSGAFSVYSTDLDGDGDADVLGAGWGCNEITWRENTDEAGTAWTEHTVDGDLNGPCSVYSIDVDGDGDSDILGAVQGFDELIWWDIMKYYSTGSLDSSILRAGE